MERWFYKPRQTPWAPINYYLTKSIPNEFLVPRYNIKFNVEDLKKKEFKYWKQMDNIYISH